MKNRVRRNPLRSKSEIWLRNIVVITVVAFFSIFVFIPIGAVFVGSFHQWNPLKGQFNFTGTANWVKAFTSDLFWKSMKNTFLFAAVATSFRIIIGLALASALYSRLIKHKSLYRVLYYLPTITPLVAVAFVWKFIFDPQIGLLDQILNKNINWLFDSRYAMPAILLLTIWKDFGYAVIILLGGMYALPQDCFEAAEIDGASAWQRFIYMTLPLLNRCSAKCKQKLPSARVRTPPTYEKREKDDTTASMHYPGGWFAVNAAAAINESPGIFTAAKRWSGGVQAGQPMVRNFASIHRLSRKKNCMKQF